MFRLPFPYQYTYSTVGHDSTLEHGLRLWPLWDTMKGLPSTFCQVGLWRPRVLSSRYQLIAEDNSIACV